MRVYRIWVVLWNFSFESAHCSVTFRKKMKVLKPQEGGGSPAAGFWGFETSQLLHRVQK